MPRILVLSSVSPKVGPAIIGEQIYLALKQKGLDVDFMTKYPEPDHPEYLWVVNENYDKRFWVRVKRKLLWWIAGCWRQKPGHFFSYTWEIFPPVPSHYVVDAIKKQYDLVVVVFWQTLLSFNSIERIYDRIHCQFQFIGVDYSQMSGGCHFTGNCQNYKTGCGKCPAVYSKYKNDFTAWNVRFRKRVYEKVKPIVYGNLYMHDFYRESYLLRNARCEILPSAIIDTDFFKPLPTGLLRMKYSIPWQKRKIVFFACQNLDDERKGLSYLIEALEILKKQLGTESSEVLIVTAGNYFERIKERIPFDSIGLGYVSMNELPEIYSLASLFVCPSVNDAGPMMVNQSLCCGTPVVGFDMGAVKQVVKGKGTGICIPLRDTQALADGIMTILQMPPEEYKKMSQKAREVALQTSSYEAQANAIMEVYEKYRNIE